MYALVDDVAPRKFAGDSKKACSVQVRWDVLRGLRCCSGGVCRADQVIPLHRARGSRLKMKEKLSLHLRQHWLEPAAPGTALQLSFSYVDSKQSMCFPPVRECALRTPE